MFTVVGLSILTFGATSASLFGMDLGFPIFELVDVEGGEWAAISVSANLEELWCLGDLLGIFCLSVVSVVFFFFGLLGSLALVIFGSMALVVGLVNVEALESMRYCG